MSWEAINRETRAEAAAWLARLHADDRSPADEEAFRAWLAADPAHAAAFEAMDHTWSLAGGLSRNRRERHGVSRRTVMAGGAGLFAVDAVQLVWPGQPRRVTRKRVFGVLLFDLAGIQLQA